MVAELVLYERRGLEEGVFTEVVVWRVPRPLRGSKHPFKYRLALVERGRCVLRYDNEAGKGDHRHVGELEEPYEFSTVEVLVEQFLSDVKKWR